LEKKDIEEMHKQCVEVCMDAHNDTPTPVGCFIDGTDEQRDLENWLGTDMSIEECIVAGRYQDFRYIGLQHGNECWGDKTIGGQGRVPSSECHMPCSRDNMAYCGGAYRNMVYDL
jgi:hypothetical protein